MRKPFIYTFCTLNFMHHFLFDTIHFRLAWLLMRLKSLSCGRFALQNSIVSILVMHWVGAMEKVLRHSKCKFRFLIKCLYAIRKLSVNFRKNFYYFTVMFFIKISLISSDIYTLFIDWKFICLCNFMVVPENIFFHYFDNESNVISFLC